MEKQNSSISNFSRFFLRILIPLVLAVGIIGFAFNLYFEKNIILKSQTNGAYKINRILHETDEDEIPIFGSSRAEMGYIPDSIGPNYFNYGLYGAMYDVTIFFLKEECKKRKSKPWILINLDLVGLQYGIDDIANYIYNADNADVKELLGENYKPYFKIPFLKYFGRYENYFRSYLTKKIEITKVTNKGATLEKQKILASEFEKLIKQRQAAIPMFHVEPKLKAQLLELIAAHPERTFVFVIAPYHSCCFPSNFDFGPIEALNRDLVQYPNSKLLDFSKMSLGNDMFFNTTHLNYSGAVVFSRCLRDTLQKMGMK